MRDYGKISPLFWTGETGRTIIEAGQEACIVSMYLMTSPHANMLGLYYLPVAYISHDTGLTIQGASKGLRCAIDAGFCGYDDKKQVVWVYEMARFQIEESLKPKDKRVIGINKEYHRLPKCCFLLSFFEKYQEHFHLQDKRENEAPSKPLRSQEQEQEQEQEDISPNGDLSPGDGDGSVSEGSNDPKPENNGKKSIPPCPHKEIISAYHSALPGCPQIRVWDETSKKNLQARWKEDESRRYVSWWAEKFQEVAESDFLMGRLNSNGGSPFMFSLGWFVKPSNFAKVLNGNYANRGQPVALKQIPCPTCQFRDSPICAKKPDEKRIACPSYREKAA